MTSPLLKIGTRGSKLALTQTGLVRDALARAVPELAAPDAIEIVVISTGGDRIQDRPLSEAQVRVAARSYCVAVGQDPDLETFYPGTCQFCKNVDIAADEVRKADAMRRALAAAEERWLELAELVEG